MWTYFCKFLTLLLCGLTGFLAYSQENHVKNPGENTFFQLKKKRIYSIYRGIHKALLTTWFFREPLNSFICRHGLWMPPCNKRYSTLFGMCTFYQQLTFVKWTTTKSVRTQTNIISVYFDWKFLSHSFW